jgi:streptogrisin C
MDVFSQMSGFALTTLEEHDAMRKTMRRASSRTRTAAMLAIVMVGTLAVTSPVKAQGVGTIASDDCGEELAAHLAQHVTYVDGIARTPAVDVEVCGYVLPLAELLDIDLIAEGKGITMAEALPRYVWQEPFVATANELQERFPDQYAGARYDEFGRSWIAFKAGAPAAAFAVTAGLPVRIIEDRGFTEAELREVLEETFSTVEALPEIVDAVGGYDQETGVITVEVVLRDGARSAELLGEPPLHQSSNSAITVEVLERSVLPGGPDAHLKGGASMSNYCTWAFGVIHTTGRTGLATAHHCATTLSGAVRQQAVYSNHDGSGLTTLDFQNRKSGSYGDIAWYSNSSHGARYWFYNNTNSTRDVRQVRSPVEGQEICMYGRGTKAAACQKVYKLNQCVKYDDYPQYCGLTATHRKIGDEGDSGGPFYYGHTAYGIHSGYKTINLINRSLFTPVHRNLFDGMGVTVRTNS